MIDATRTEKQILTMEQLAEKFGVSEYVLCKFYKYCRFELEELIDSFSKHYQGAYKDLSDWAEQFLDDTDFFNIGYQCDITLIKSEKKSIEDHLSQIKTYFDYESYGLDCKLSGEIFTIEGDDGYTHVFTSL